MDHEFDQMTRFCRHCGTEEEVAASTDKPCIGPAPKWVRLAPWLRPLGLPSEIMETSA